jgi:hypothetical protein
MSQMCVDVTLLPSDKLIVIGLSDLRRFLTGVPFITKIDVAPVSAIACNLAIVIAFTHSNCLMKAAAAAYFVLQLDVIIVASSSSCGANAAIWLVDWVGYNEAVGHKLFNLTSNFIAPHRQANRYTVLCIAFLQKGYPACSYCL